MMKNQPKLKIMSKSFNFLHQDLLYSTPKSWILQDSQSMVDVFLNGKVLSNMQDAKNVLTLDCIAGKAL